MPCNVSASERTSLDGSSFGRHSAFGAERKKAQALFDGGLGLGVRHRRRDINVRVQADEQVELVVLLGEGVPAEAQVGDLSGILWARHTMSESGNGYADQEKEADGGSAGSGPRAAACAA